jgi:hypothetical protein
VTGCFLHRSVRVVHVGPFGGFAAVCGPRGEAVGSHLWNGLIGCGSSAVVNPSVVRRAEPVVLCISASDAVEEWGQQSPIDRFAWKVKVRSRGVLAFVRCDVQRHRCCSMDSSDGVNAS